MRNSTGSTRALVKGRTEGRPVVASLGGTAAGFLTLPFISNQVPATSVIDGDEGKWLQTARLCAELVEDDELVIHDRTSARDIIGLSLSAWASKHCADIQVLDKFELIASLERDAFGLDYDSEQKEKCLYIGFQSQQTTPYINVKAKVEMLESAHPGLGRTAVSIAELASYRTFTAFTPQVALHHASYLYWCGMDNDEDFKEEMGINGDEGELDDDALLPSQFLASFPSYFFTGENLERDLIQRIATIAEPAGETARVILSIMDLIDQDARLPYLDSFYGESVYFSCYLGTGEDMLGRVLDDFYQSTSDGGEYTDMYGVAEVAFNKRAFLKWKAQMEKGFALYTQLDRLMRCIGEVQ
ncbi:MAG: PRTRC system protein F [Sideroxyarcus sp.]|nr:PRTRC system protein F [Sideroxyarcus sp.]